MELSRYTRRDEMPLMRPLPLSRSTGAPDPEVDVHSQGTGPWGDQQGLLQRQEQRQYFGLAESTEDRWNERTDVCGGHPLRSLAVFGREAFASSLFSCV